MEGDALLFVDADEIEAARLVGGEGEAHLIAQEPIGKAAGTADLDWGLPRLRLGGFTGRLGRLGLSCLALRCFSPSGFGFAG